MNAKTAYIVSVRGPVPPDLAEKLAIAHAAAVQAASKPAKEMPAVSPAGHVEVRCDGSDNPH